MSYMLGRFKYDVNSWKRVIESDRAAHQAAGLHFKQVWTNVEDPSEIFFLFEVDDLPGAKSFLQKAGALDKEKQARGEIPELIFLESA